MGWVAYLWTNSLMIVCSLVLTSCRPGEIRDELSLLKGDDSNRRSDPCSPDGRDEISGAENVTNSQLNDIYCLLNGRSEAAIPPSPRTILIFSADHILNQGAFDVTISRDFGKVALGANVSKVFTLSYSSNLTLAKNTGSGKSKFILTPEGNIDFNENDPIVYYCSYSAAASSTFASGWRIKILVVNASQSTSDVSSIKAEKISSFYFVTPQDTVFGLREKCLKHFKNDAEIEVIGNLRRAIAAVAGIDNKSVPSDYELALDAFMGRGSDHRGLSLFGNKINIANRSGWSKIENNAFVVGGGYYAWRKWMGIIPQVAEQINFKFYFELDTCNLITSGPKTQNDLEFLNKDGAKAQTSHFLATSYCYEKQAERNRKNGA